MTYPVPVLIIAWRRPLLLRRLLEATRAIAPEQVFVACDGPRPGRPDEAQKVAACRELIEREIDWPCSLRRFYSEQNLGCRHGVSRAISWFFEQVEEGIIFEDDCIPHPDFFAYGRELLERYRHDTRIWSVCGSNFQLGRRRGRASYYYSIHGDSWGWATWRRAWIHYDSAQQFWPEFRRSRRFADVFPIPLERLYWRLTLDTMFGDPESKAWDYQWWLAGWMNHALHVWPNANLICNAGFDSDGTHTIRPTRFAALPSVALGQLEHPRFVIPDRQADAFAFYHRRSAFRYLLKRLLLVPFFWCS